MDIREYLISQGVWEREVDEIISNFDENVSKEDMTINRIFDSKWDLGDNYIDSKVEKLDPYIDIVLDRAELGRVLAENQDELLLLESGRVIEFEI